MQDEDALVGGVRRPGGIGRKIGNMRSLIARRAEAINQQPVQRLVIR
jgi:hypothetical protein